MNEEIKKACEEFRKAKEKVDKLILNEYDTKEEIEEVKSLLEKQKIAHRNYRVFLYENRGWSEEKINRYLKILGLWLQ